MQHVFLFAVLLCSTVTAKSQTYEPLSIGDQVPDIELNVSLNNVTSKIKISALKGKLVLLDFWNVKCSPCIQAMPKMDSLQNQFKEKIQILFVTKDATQQVEKLFSKIKIKKPPLPFLVGDTVLNQLFPYRIVPFHVWIDEEGKVKYITWDYNASASNIEKILNRRELKLSRKWDFGLQANYPLVSEGNSKLLDLPKQYSILLKGLYEFTGNNEFNIELDSVTGKPVFIRAINKSLLQFFQIAYSNELLGFGADVFQASKNNRIIISVKDPYKLSQPTDDRLLDNWNSQNLLSYEAGVPPESQVDLYAVMQQDLNRFSTFQATVEKRVVCCLVLEKKNSVLESSEKKLNAPVVYQFNKDQSLTIRNMPVSAFVRRLILFHNKLSTPIIDRTNYQFGVDLDLKPMELGDISKLKKQLNRFGFDLVEKEVEIDMLVIRDK